MDYETTVECHRELLNNGPYREEAIDLLMTEVTASAVLRDAERAKLLDALEEIRIQQAFGESGAVKRFWHVLNQNETFRIERITRRLMGEI